MTVPATRVDLSEPADRRAGLRVLHVADVHLGAALKVLGERGGEQREQIRRTFARCIDLALEKGCHVVLIAGDLFDSPRPPSATVEFAAEQLQRLVGAGVRVFAISGNHDGGPDSIWAQPHFRERIAGVEVFSETPRTVVVPELDLSVTGSSPAPGNGRSPLSDWEARRTTTFAVGVAHGSAYRGGQSEGPEMIRPEEIRSLGLDYLALGDWHSAQQVHPAPCAAWYAGAPELLNIDQPGCGNALLVTLRRPGEAAVEVIRVGRRTLLIESVDAAEATDELLRAVLERLADPDAVLDLTIRGLRTVDRTLSVDTLRREFAESFFRLRITDASHPRLDRDELNRFEATTVLGQFVRRMHERIERAPPDQRAVLEEALQVGVRALQGRGVGA
jgi:DNA repair exonuclease SbcCD nuclease subunit